MQCIEITFSFLFAGFLLGGALLVGLEEWRSGPGEEELKKLPKLLETVTEKESVSRKDDEKLEDKQRLHIQTNLESHPCVAAPGFD